MRVRARGFNEAGRFTAALPTDGGLDLASGSTVENLLQRLEVPDEFLSDLVILVNGRPAALTTKLAENDRVIFFAAMTGG
jgi:molybdopterin converting factor small subunit